MESLGSDIALPLPGSKPKRKRETWAERKAREAKAKAVKRKPKKTVRKTSKPKTKTKTKTKNPTIRQGAPRSCRMDIRLTKAEKAKLCAAAKRTDRTVTSLLLSWIDKLK